MALVFFGFGLFMLSFAAGVLLPAGPRESPPWVAAAAGAMFLAGGVLPLAYALEAPPWVGQLAGFAMAVCLAAIFHWVAFGPGPRAFSSSLSMPGLATATGHPDESTGRLVFGAFALLIDAVLVAGAWRWWRGRGARPGNGA
jgi:hypothetical protein